MLPHKGGSTMSRLSTVAGFLLSISLLAGPLALVPAAQAQNGVIANIPFEFSVNNQRLTAGTYFLELTSSHLMRLRNTRTRKGQFLMVLPEHTKATPSQGRLIFNRYGSNLYLSQVWISGSNEYSKCVQSRSERQSIFEAKNASQTNVEVALNSPGK
jgi:hypothetical protein